MQIAPLWDIRSNLLYRCLHWYVLSEKYAMNERIECRVEKMLTL
jgi:hypothetical protein